MTSIQDYIIYVLEEQGPLPAWRLATWVRRESKNQFRPTSFEVYSNLTMLEKRGKVVRVPDPLTGGTKWQIPDKNVLQKAASALSTSAQSVPPQRLQQSGAAVKQEAEEIVRGWHHGQKGRISQIGGIGDGLRRWFKGISQRKSSK